MLQIDILNLLNGAGNEIRTRTKSLEGSCATVNTIPAKQASAPTCSSNLSVGQCAAYLSLRGVVVFIYGGKQWYRSTRSKAQKD